MNKNIESKKIKRKDSIHLSDWQRLQLIIFAMIILGMISVLIVGKNGVVKIYQMKKEKILLEQEIDKLTTEKQNLIKKCELLQNDPQYIEKYARENYGMSRDREIIYKIVDKDGSR